MKTQLLLPSAAGLMLAAASVVEADTTIQLGTPQASSQPEMTTSAFQINLPNPGEYKIRVTGWVSTYNWGADYDRLYLYNDEGETVQRGLFSYEEDPFAFHMFEDSDQLIFRVGTAGTYTIKLHSGDLPGEGASQSYTLLVTETANCNDGHEPNDSLAAATAIMPGATVHGFQWRRTKTAEVQGDEDWYKIQVPTPGKLTISLVGWIGVYNWGSDFDRLFVYDANGTNIGGNPEDGDDGYYAWMMEQTDELPRVIEMNLAKGGTYYLRFHAGNSVPGTPYHFTTTFTQGNDTFEPNDEFATAKPISQEDTWYDAFAWRSLDQTMNVFGDEDYYYFQAASAGTYTLTLENWVSIYNWGADYDRVYIYDANQQIVGNEPHGHMMGDGPVTIEVPAAGKYYIRLHCGAGTSLDGYRFKLTGNLLGTGSAEIAVEQPRGKSLTSGSGKTNFGKAKVRKTGKSKTYLIRNEGVSTLTLNKISRSGSGAKSFLVSKLRTSNLAPGKSTTIKVVFKPKTKGKLKAVLSLKNSDSDENPFEINLIGRGVK